MLSVCHGVMLCIFHQTEFTFFAICMCFTRGVSLLILWRARPIPSQCFVLVLHVSAYLHHFIAMGFYTCQVSYSTLRAKGLVRLVCSPGEWFSLETPLTWHVTILKLHGQVAIECQLKNARRCRLHPECPQIHFRWTF